VRAFMYCFFIDWKNNRWWLFHALNPTRQNGVMSYDREGYLWIVYRSDPIRSTAKRIQFQKLSVLRSLEYTAHVGLGHTRWIVKITNTNVRRWLGENMASTSKEKPEKKN
jgi:hypothetical protein